LMEISGHLAAMAANGHLDGGVVALARSNLEACWHAARGELDAAPPA
jgi:hypothetical protein